MATDFHTLGILLHPNTDIPEFESSYEIFEYHDEFLFQKSDEEFINYVLSGSRRGWLRYSLEKLCEKAEITSLGFLYGGSTVRIDSAFEESVEGVGAWCVWKRLTMAPAQMGEVVLAISTLFDWSSRHVSALSESDFLSGLADEDEIRNAIAQPIITKEPTFDNRVKHSDDGDGPWCLYSFLRSMQQLIHNAIEQDVALLYMVQVPL